MRIDDFEFDDANEAHMAKHGVTKAECLEVIAEGRFFARPNKKAHHQQTHIIIGLTANGRWLFIPVRPTGHFGIWRPASARTARPHERR